MFACVCVAAKRQLGMRPYNVQLIGGYELHRGCIAEMATGEGKTLVATLSASLNAVSGRGVHIVTVNDYLAKRDSDIMTPLYAALGFRVGVIVAGMNDDERLAATYACDIVYGTNKELGFDYLRDQIKLHTRNQHQKIDALTLLNRRESHEPVMRQLNYALVDEADSILIDESRTPLIIAGPSGPSPTGWAYEWANALAQRLFGRGMILNLSRRSGSWSGNRRDWLACKNSGRDDHAKRDWGELAESGAQRPARAASLCAGTTLCDHHGRGGNG